ncbi:uncharacterized protein LOC115880598 [Sitophilus oryzae]|uniref:Uncharacterized protein LOC115880598 n=1 Tax=Sitophilus oryzae TaxID=7048 RepID=A0A6J2XQF2_SITOR|nr:uncharacterized protein LOC115880598 [Sitophilus oryzae]
MKYQKLVGIVLVFAVSLGYSQAEKEIKLEIEQKIADGVTAECTAQNVTAVNATKDASDFQLRGIYTSYGDLNLGYVGRYDQLLFNRIYYANYGELVLRVYSPYYRLSAIRIHNYHYGGYSPSVSILDGAVGYQHVMISMRSMSYSYNTPFQYSIQLYGF